MSVSNSNSNKNNMATFENKIEIDSTPVTTTFVNDGAVETKKYTTTMDSGDLDIINQGIKDFMQKPVLINVKDWATTQNPLIELQQIIPENYLTSVTDWKNKIAGYNLVRGTAVLTVLLNATPFQQGRLILSFTPYSAMDSLATKYGSLTSVTQLPNLELDCRETAIQMKIPYIAPTDWYSINDASQQYTFGWGQFSLRVLSPLTVGAAAELSVEVAIYLHWEDFELAAPIVPQSGSKGRSFKTRKFKTIEEMEQIQPTLSQGLRNVSSVAASLQSVPQIGAIAGVAAWVTGAASAVASYFGWSKPVVDTPSQTSAQQIVKYNATSDGDCNSFPLALRSDNRLTITDAYSIRSEDEMSFEFLKGVNCLVDTFTWHLSDNSNSELYLSNVSPNKWPSIVNKVFVGHTLKAAYLHPVGYISRFFKYWRGSIKLTFKFVKTQFHTGRLQFAWTPLQNITTLPDTVNSAFSMREIVDLTASDEVVLTLPFMLPFRYAQAGYIDEPSGNIRINVLNQLRAPETVAPTVQVLMFLSFGDDFELQAPSNYANTVTSAVSLEAGDGSSTIIVEPIGSMPEKHLTTQYSEQCIGEHFSSVRQMITRFTRLYNDTTVGSNGFKIWPWVIGMVRIDHSSGLIAATNILGGDAFSAIAPMYAFMKGGMRLNITPQDPTVPISLILDNSIALGGSATYDVPSTLIKDSATVNWHDQTVVASQPITAIGLTKTNAYVGTFPVEIPYYCACKVTPVLTGTLNTAGGLPGTAGVVARSQPSSNMSCYGNSAFATLGLERAVREDFVLSYFLAAPPVFVLYT